MTGTVVARWRVRGMGDQFYRIAVQRVPGQPQNPDGKNFDAINVRFPLVLGRAPQWSKGDLVEVTGFLQQRDVEERLADLVKRAKRLSSEAGKEILGQLNGAFLQRAVYEVVATHGAVIAERE
jgi:hypothetical protein